MKIAVIHVNYLGSPREANVRSQNFNEAAALAYIRTNLELNYGFMRRAGEQKADLVVTNEDFGCIGRYRNNLKYPDLFFDLTARLEGEITAALSKIAAQYKMNIAANEYRTCDGLVYNTSTFYSRGGDVLGRQDKVHLATTERFKAAQGNQISVIETDLGAVGFCICYDILFPEFCRSLSLQGAEIILHQTQGWGFGGAPARQAGEAIVRTRAFENSVYFVVAKNVQNEGGYSCVLDTYGDIQASAQGREDQLLMADINPDFLSLDKYGLGNFYAGTESGKTTQLLGRRPQMYGALIDPNPQVLKKLPGRLLESGEELDSRFRDLAEMEVNNPEERARYHWHKKI
ncbi:MAG: carbon-nitrogen hydrolase family protein [Treponema sp.]|nr:carbon-nitrogen hydrolase family protein [Treponema sp.]